MKIKRTRLASVPAKSAVKLDDPWGWEGALFADVVHEGDYPTHSPILGPDGRRLEYEPRPPMGFDLRPRK